MTLITYAQNFEDVLLWRALHDVIAGRYIDIGAHDPVFDSVSLAFYNAGWRGIHIDPVPSFAERLREARPDEIVIEAAVTDATGVMEFYDVAQSGLSTGKSDIANHHSRAGFISEKIRVRCVSLDEVLGTLSSDIHWMKIDVEGMEAEVLRSWRGNPARPWVVAIEATFPNSQQPMQHVWAGELTGRGYREVAFDGLNRYYLHETQSGRKARFEAPANIFDRFSITANHFAAAELRAEIGTREERARSDERQAQAAEIGGLRRKLSARDRTIRERREELKSLQLARDEARAAAERTGSKLQEATAKLASARTERRSLMRAFARERDALEQQLRSRFEFQVTRAREFAERSQKRVSEERARAAEFESKLAEALEGWTRSRGEIRKLRRSLEAARLASEQEQAKMRSALAEAQQRISWQSRRAAHSDMLIRGAADEHKERRHPLLRLFQSRANAPAFEALIDYSSSTPPLTETGESADRAITNGMDNPMMTAAENEMSNAYHRANSLQELLAWDDVDFVRCAYVTVLGRQPDTEGEAYYTNRLRMGRSKLEVLDQLRASPEAKNHDPGIAGFDRTLRNYRRRQLPIIGWLLRKVTGGEGNSPAENSARMIGNRLALVQAQLSQLAALSRAIDEVRHTTGDVQRQVQEFSLRGLRRPGQIAPAEAAVRESLSPKARRFFDRNRLASRRGQRLH